MFGINPVGSLGGVLCNLARESDRFDMRGRAER